MLKNLFSSDKAPFVLPLTLTILSWFISTIISNISDVTIVQISSTKKDNHLIYDFTNHSLKTSLNGAYFQFSCADKNTTDCFVTLSTVPPNNYIDANELVPYAIVGNKICSNKSKSITAIFSLPTGASIRYTLAPVKDAKVDVVFAGLIPKDVKGCPDTESRYDVTNIWLYTGNSLTLYFIRNYFQILISLMALTLVFLIFILFIPRKKSSVTDEV